MKTIHPMVNVSRYADIARPFLWTNFIVFKLAENFPALRCMNNAIKSAATSVMKTSANPMPPSAGGGSGDGLLGCVVVVVPPGSEGEIVGAPPGSCGVIAGLVCGDGGLPGNDGVIENPPLDGVEGAG